MTDSINHYIFDFKNEAERLIREPIRGLNKVLLAEVHPSSAGIKDAHQHVDVLQKIGTQKISDKCLTKSLKKHFHVSSSSAMADFKRLFGGTNYIMAFNGEDRFTEVLGESNKQAQLLFTLYHETGHALIPGGTRTTRSPTPGEMPSDTLSPAGSTYPFGECAADAYAAMRLFQRFGEEAKPFLSLVSWMRAYMGAITHLTTTVLDKVIADSSGKDFFTKLSPQETVQQAETYAKELTPQPDMLAAFKRIYSDNKKNPRMSDVVEACLSAASDDFSFYIGAKIAQPNLHHGGLISDGELVQWEESRLAAFAAAIKERSVRKASPCPASGNSEALPFEKSLPIFLPAHQEKVVLNW